jgi:hypothetical protein
MRHAEAGEQGLSIFHPIVADFQNLLRCPDAYIFLHLEQLHAGWVERGFSPETRGANVEEAARRRRFPRRATIG